MMHEMHHSVLLTQWFTEVRHTLTASWIEKTLINTLNLYAKSLHIIAYFKR
jgi:hypothetical protein